MSEWPKVLVLKANVFEIPWVQIPPYPNFFFSVFLFYFYFIQFFINLLMFNFLC